MERVLIADCDAELRDTVARSLSAVGADIVTAATAEQAMARMKDPLLAVVVAADRPEFDGRSLLESASVAPRAARILLTFRRTPPTPLRRTDVLRFVAEPLVKENLEAIVRDALRRHRLEGQPLTPTRIERDMDKMQNRQKLLDAVVVERTREIQTAYEKLQEASREAIQALAQAIEARDPYTKGHSARVARYAIALARETRYPEKDMETLEFAAFLHDVGKIGVRDAVLLKAGSLDDEEWKEMRRHPMMGYEIAVKLEMMRPLLACIRNHHERWDGTGYPDKLVGENIPLIARVVSIADAFDAMATDRPYKAALSLDESIAAFRKQRAKMYDPQLTDLFIERVIGELKVA